MSGAAALLAGTSPLTDEQRSLLELLDAAAEHTVLIIEVRCCASAEATGARADINALRRTFCIMVRCRVAIFLWRASRCGLAATCWIPRGA